MARFERDGLSFDPPSGWLDVSIATFDPGLPPDSAEVCTFIVANEPLAPDESLRAHLQKKLMTVSKALPEFKYLDTGEDELGGRPSIVIRYSWANEATRILQCLVGTEIPKPNGRAAIVITTSSSAAHDEAHRRAFDLTLASFDLAPKTG